MDYFNDPKLNGKYLGTITKDFATVSDTRPSLLSYPRNWR